MKLPKNCPQCGSPYKDEACGPSHALVRSELSMIAAKTKRLKQSLARISWRLPRDQRATFVRDVNLTIDQWAERERRKGWSER